MGKGHSKMLQSFDALKHEEFFFYRKNNIVTTKVTYCPERIGSRKTGK